jgi:hypothetical protein
MPHATFTVDPDGFILDVMIGVTGKKLASLAAAGQALPRPVMLRGAIDTGSDVTCVNSQVLSGFGLKAVIRLSSTTVAGSVPANLFEVSFNIPCVGKLPAALLVLDHLQVMELVQTLQGIDVLIDRDVLRQMLFISDGPRDQFTLAD